MSDVVITTIGRLLLVKAEDLQITETSNNKVKRILNTILINYECDSIGKNLEDNGRVAFQKKD